MGVVAAFMEPVGQRHAPGRRRCDAHVYLRAPTIASRPPIMNDALVGGGARNGPPYRGRAKRCSPRSADEESDTGYYVASNVG